jgi:hypothetical protein
MHQSGANHEMCTKLLSTPEGVDTYNQYNCSEPGFYGRPVHFDYTTLSNGDWKKERCEGQMVGSPMVL